VYDRAAVYARALLQATAIAIMIFASTSLTCLLRDFWLFWLVIIQVSEFGYRP